MRKFETGAVRSSDADEERYDLISPIALAEVAHAANRYIWRNTCKEILFNMSVGHINLYLEGDHDVKYFAKAALFLMAIFDTDGISDTIPITNNIEKCDYFNLPPLGMASLARRHKLGADNYGEFSWERGMPISDLCNHLLRHLYLFRFKKIHLSEEEAVEDDDDDLGAAIWGCFACIHSHIQWPHLNTLLRSEGCKLNPEIIKDLENFQKRKDNEHLGLKQGIFGESNK